MPHLIITAGEPAGIGPDIILQLAQQSWPAALTIAGDPDMLQKRATQLGLPITLYLTEVDSTVPPHTPGSLYVLPVPVAVPVVAGQLDTANAAYVLEMLRVACQGCLDGHFDALITAPVHKGVINDAGIPFSGHTEFFAGQCGVQQVVMLLATPTLRVALVTTHLPLQAVSTAITAERLQSVIHILHQDLQRRFHLPTPRILVCGLNPHAGEDGHLGREEIEVIEPVLNHLRDTGLNLLGPVPADTAFTPGSLQQVDAVLAMYHDQGLPVLKAQGFGEAVNITLGLPVIRTSVDHGTALMLAGTGQARADSLAAAIQMACELAGSSNSSMA